MSAHIKLDILAFASHLDDPKKDPELKARDRRWLDGAGQPTEDGLQLISAIGEQAGTRTAFRYI